MESVGEDYEIRVEGLLSASWQEWFEGMEIRPASEGSSLLWGRLKDQSALQAVLNRLLNLNLKLISIRRCGRGDEPSEKSESERRSYR